MLDMDGNCDDDDEDYGGDDYDDGDDDHFCIFASSAQTPASKA